jgi:hypothetical protein
LGFEQYFEQKILKCPIDVKNFDVQRTILEKKSREPYNASFGPLQKVRFKGENYSILKSYPFSKKSPYLEKFTLAKLCWQYTCHLIIWQTSSRSLYYQTDNSFHPVSISVIAYPHHFFLISATIILRKDNDFM